MQTIFIIVGETGTILSSPDAITWTKQTTGITKHLMGIIYVNNMFVVMGWGGTNLTCIPAIIISLP
jgi:hypothetical protein